MDMYEEFEVYYPRLAELAIEYFDKPPEELIVRLSDGRLISYYSPEKTVRTLSIDPNDTNDDQFKREFAKRLRRLMFYKGISQMKLSEMTGISSVVLSRYMSAITCPSFYAVDKIARALKCSTDDLRFDQERYER